MNDAVDRVIVERGAMERGLEGSLLASFFGHFFLIGGAVIVALIGPKEPPLKVMDGFAVALPPGGGGSPAAQNPAPAVQSQAPPQAPPPEAAPPPKILKPPKEEPRKGLPDVDAKKSKKKADKSPPPAPRSGGVAGGTGTSAQTPGLEFGPPGPGVPGGTDMLGDWYLAGVQRKIWVIWSQQVRTDTPQAVTVRFTILADGSITDVSVVQGSGIVTLDLAAQRAISSAAPFGPLPKNYGTDRYTIQAVFKPTS
jgi:protein TonB